MIAVSLKNGRVEVIELPRPQLEQPTDAIVMVTTTAIGHWEMQQAARTGAFKTPGTQFAGIVVETGSDVTSVAIDDLVAARGVGVLGSGKPARFGEGSLAGGHAEYVRVPLADQTLVATHPSAEERTVFAGGEAALGFRAADNAVEAADGGSIYLMGCDAPSYCALARIRQRLGRKMDVFITSSDSDICATAIAMGARDAGHLERETRMAAAAIITSLGTIATPPGIPAFTPYASSGTAELDEMPTLEETRRAESAIRLRQVDLTPIVATVLPLDQAEEAYRVALDSKSGMRAVLLKP